MSCKQPNAEFRLDTFRLYEGDYVPYEQAARQEAAAAAVNLFDTGVPSAGAACRARSLAKRTGWTEVPEDKTDHAFRGDAVVVNDRLAAGAAPRRGRGRSCTRQGAKGLALRAVLTPAAEAAAKPAIAWPSSRTTPSEVAVDAAFQTPGGKSFGLRFELGDGPGVREDRAAARGAGVERRGPVPLRRAARLLRRRHRDRRRGNPRGRGRTAQRELPAAPAARPRRDRDDRGRATASRTPGSTLSGQGTQRLIDSSEMYYGDKGKIWVAVLEGRDVWHQRDVAKRRGRQDRSAGLDRPVSRPVARRLATGRQADRQLGDGRRSSAAASS